MSGFEYRDALPDVLDAVHKKTVVDRLNHLGFEASIEMDWSEVYEYAEQERDHNDSHIFSLLLYGGLRNIGSILGRPHNYLQASFTDGSFHHGDEAAYMGAKSRIIELGEAQDAITSHAWLFVAPGLPPYAMRKDHIDAVLKQDPQLDFRAEVGRFFNAVQSAFGNKVVDYIDEPTAQTITDALKQEQPQVGRIDPNAPPFR
jgi:hypothetical protein